MWKNSTQSKKGFTLIEVMVVISIIGILVSILVLSFNDARKSARDNSRKASLKQLQLAIETYRAQNGMYPASGCAAAPGKWVGPGQHTASWGVSCAAYIAGLSPDFISQLPQDPTQESVDNTGFIYTTDAARSAYKVLAYSSVEANWVTSFSDEFARIPRECGWGVSVPQTNTYAVYSKGAECW